MSIRIKENAHPNKEAGRVFPNPQVLTTPIKHFFKAGTPQKTPNKPVVNSPSTFSTLTRQLSSPKAGSPKREVRSPKRSVSALETRVSIADSRGERVSVMDRPRESILAELASISSRASYLDSSRVSSYSSDSYESRPSSLEYRASIASRPSLVENRPSLLVLSPSHGKSPSHQVPVNSKIQFYEKNDAAASGANNNTIEYYEKLYNVGRSTSTPGKRDVVMKQDEWRTMLSGLIEQIQAKDDMLESAQGRIESLEETVDDCRRENIIIREEIREKNAEIIRLGNFLTQQSADTSSEIEELRRFNEELLEEQRAREVQLSMLRSEVGENYSRQSLGGADDESVRNELELAFNEVDRLAKKLASKNSELKSYKQKVDSFLGLDPRSKQGKRQSSGGHEQSSSKKSRK